MERAQQNKKKKIDELRLEDLDLDEDINKYVKTVESMNEKWKLTDKLPEGQLRN